MPQALGVWRREEEMSVADVVVSRFPSLQRVFVDVSVFDGESVNWRDGSAEVQSCRS